MQTSRVAEWVQFCEHWCEPDWIHWCDGSAQDLLRLTNLRDMSPPTVPKGAGKCVTVDEAMTQIARHCQGLLRGRILFVVPYLRAGDEAGIMLTDSAAVATAFYRTADIGAPALAFLETGHEFTAQLLLTGSENSRDDGVIGEQDIRCHLSGPAVIDTACRTNRRPRQNLPVNAAPDAPASAGKSSCVTCGRVCPNRARALAKSSGIRHFADGSPSMP
ncbi:MAG: hypothetical protein V4671_13130 [Armatimonadota bacterium]